MDWSEVIKELHEQCMQHMQIADKHKESDSIWISRMATANICGSFASALMKGRDAHNAE